MKKIIQRTGAVLLCVCVLAVTMFCNNGFVTCAGKVQYVLQDRSAQELMKEFGVIAFDKASLQTHFHGNFLVDTLSMNANAGLRSDYNTHETFYFRQALSVSSNISELNDDVLYTGAAVRKQNGTENYISLVGGAEAKVDRPHTIHTDAELRAQGNYEAYADMDALRTKFASYNKGLAGLAADGNVDMDITGDMNNRKVVVKSGSQNVISLKYNELTSSTNAIYFQFPDYDNDDILVINVDMKGVTAAHFGEMVLGSKDAAKKNSEENFTKKYNRMIFNFYDSGQADNQYTGSILFGGRGFGTVIAPYASVSMGQNWDGSVVAGSFQNGGQFHRVNGTKYPDVPVGTPTVKPTSVPTTVPTMKPTSAPTAAPTAVPTVKPTIVPTAVPTVKPTIVPTVKPTSVPTNVPTGIPTIKPTAGPNASGNPTPSVSAVPVKTDSPVFSAESKQTSVPVRTDTPKNGRNKGTGKLIVTVTDEKTGNSVPNAKVRIVNSRGISKTYTTDKNGQIKLTGMPVGKAKITVLKVPDGYTVTTNKTTSAIIVRNKTVDREVRIKTDGSSGSTNSSKTTGGDSCSEPKTGDWYDGRIPAMLLTFSVFGITALCVNRKRQKKA